ncbi:hypothetical protein IV102_08865 [bacterium]|nr:hypothetical protein [bacterium]
MKPAFWLCALLLTGCAQHGFAAFVVNQDAHSQAKPGKSYSAEPCTLRNQNGILQLGSGPAGADGSLQLRVAIPPGQSLEALLGRTLEGGSGEAQVNQARLTLEKGSFTLQTLQSGVARGNFNARVKGQDPPWEVVGSFEARLQ